MTVSRPGACHEREGGRVSHFAEKTVYTRLELYVTKRERNSRCLSAEFDPFLKQLLIHFA